ncbi:ribonuclease J [Candidatus Berkelbacteria bacterium CG08_land_8_20_14_0_20_39_8]|uniref:Ribonuclease J n=1 Tax=Candidatus Berkelbacteria bacterium CG08_land_8_20_14_0_20_39_8 TaxID=1974511 RepID=A0A2M6YD63_9BACT|nr:MAG: ribonuclease J [Candidatus Berkelbacteria bacterium CG08_land_8_20_14_0_20_39_8]
MITQQGSTRSISSRSHNRPVSRSRGIRKTDLSKTFGNLTPNISNGNYLQTKSSENNFSNTAALRFIPLGGLEEVGKNMTAIEYGNDIIVIDAGLMFPNEDMPGIDYVIPDISYLAENKSKIRGLVITHGHLDHTGAIPYLYEKLGSPQIYSAPMTVGLIKKRLEEFSMENKVKISTIIPGEEILQLGCFKIETFRLNHNIPDSFGLSITTPEGILVYATDWKFDHTPADGRPTDFSKLAQLGGQGVLALFSDSTNAEKPGHTMSEKDVEDSLFKLVENARGRIIMATFASLISRIQQILNVSKRMNRKVAFSGRSMIANVEVAASIQALIIPPETMVDVNDIGKYPDNRITIVCTGSQGEERSALTRIAAGEHRQIKIKKGDTVIFSSSPIPGNERSVSEVMDNLYRDGARVIYQKLFDVHTSGHAYQEDLKLMIGLIKPKFFVPIHGERHKLMVHAGLATDVGIPEENVLVSDNGQIIEFSAGRGAVTNKRVPVSYVMVDGLGVGDVGNIVLRDRKAMAEDGIFVIIVTVSHETGQIVTSPDIISRGFIYMRENENLVHKARAEIKRLFVKHSAGKNSRGNWNLIKTKLREDLGDFLYKETERRPMVIPVVIEV